MFRRYVLSFFNFPFFFLSLSVLICLSVCSSGLAFSPVPRETGLFPWQCLQAEQCICLKLDKIRVSFIPFTHTHTHARTHAHAQMHTQNTQRMFKCVGKSTRMHAFMHTGNPRIYTHTHIAIWKHEDKRIQINMDRAQVCGHKDSHGHTHTQTHRSHVNKHAYKHTQT